MSIVPNPDGLFFLWVCVRVSQSHAPLPASVQQAQRNVLPFELEVLGSSGGSSWTKMATTASCVRIRSSTVSMVTTPAWCLFFFPELVDSRDATLLFFLFFLFFVLVGWFCNSYSWLPSFTIFFWSSWLWFINHPWWFREHIRQSHCGEGRMQMTLELSLSLLARTFLVIFPTINEALAVKEVCIDRDFFLGNGLCAKDKPTTPFSLWKFAKNDLLERFPIDHEKRNFVRDVPQVLFSKVLPEPLKTIRKLVATSDSALENLDLDSNDVGKSGLFVDVAAGNTVLSGSVPLAHRYGGHQVFVDWSSILKVL